MVVDIEAGARARPTYALGLPVGYSIAPYDTFVATLGAPALARRYSLLPRRPFGFAFVSYGLPPGSTLLKGIPEGLLLKAPGLPFHDICLPASDATGLHLCFNCFVALLSGFYVDI